MKKLSLLLICTLGIIFSLEAQKLSKKDKLKEKILKSDEWQQMSTAYLAHYTHRKNKFLFYKEDKFQCYIYILNELDDNLKEKQKAFRKAFPRTHKFYNPEEYVKTFLEPLWEAHKAKYSNIKLVSK